MRNALIPPWALVLALTAAAVEAKDAKRTELAGLDELYPQLDAFYIDLHQTPELSLHEEKTAAKLADKLRRLGYEVTTGVGGLGVVAVMRNGSGRTLLLRADMDALPVKEQTGLPYASKVTTKDDSGAVVPVMHACGHDMHMTSLFGAAALLAKAKDRWRGTLVLIGQPAEEKVSGAAAMLKDGLLSRFPKPDFAIALHVADDIPAGRLGYTPGYALANVDSVDITIFGRGGHGAYPHRTVDPIVIAARTIVALQTIVARENNPIDPAVVTVGSIHGGSKHNIIPDEVTLQLTVRSYKDEVRSRVLAAIARIAKAEAAAAGAPKEPSVTVGESVFATYNDPALTRRIAGVLGQAFGGPNVVEKAPQMGAEDFGAFARAGVPGVLFWLGAVEPERFEKSKAGGAPLPSVHSSEFAPDRQRTIRTGVSALTLVALDLLDKS
jgi:hippurate hydrolase